jgi:hypothetical protein
MKALMDNVRFEEGGVVVHAKERPRRQPDRTEEVAGVALFADLTGQFVSDVFTK